MARATTWRLVAAVVTIFAGGFVADARTRHCRHDTDCDGLSNKTERLLGTDPTSADTDHDGLGDEQEVDRLGTDPLDADSDHDGLDDLAELAAGTNPTDADTDGDGTMDGADDDPTAELQPRLAGPVDAVDAVAATIKVFGLVIDASTARFDDGVTLDGIVPGTFVVVKLDAAKLPGLVATRIRVASDGGPPPDGGNGDGGDDGKKKHRPGGRGD